MEPNEREGVFRAGRKAHDTGRPATWNPYLPSDAKHDWWRRGWKCGQALIELRKREILRRRACAG